MKWAWSFRTKPRLEARQCRLLALWRAIDLFVNSEAQRLVVDLRQDGGSPVVKIIISLVVEEP
jgi:hypothetical protein